MSLNRRRFLRFLGSLLVIGTGSGYWLRLEAEQLELVRRKIRIKGLRRPLRLLQLSDFHASPVVRTAYLRSVIAASLAEKPDVICLTGDYTTDGIDDWASLTALLAPLAQAAPTLAIPGNHDGTPGAPDGLYAHTVAALSEAGISVLGNVRHRVPIAGETLQVVGTGDLWRGDFRPLDAFRGAQRDLPTVLLTHNPDARLAILPFSWNLCLCGHTHGGQINLPGLRGKFAPIKDLHYLAGSFAQGDRTLYVNRGIGSIGGIRYGARPEVTVFALLPVG